MPRWSSYDVDKNIINVKKNIRMKNQINFYAQARISFYEARLQLKNTPQLVDEFNQLAQSRGWTAERSYFSVALENVMVESGIDVSAMSSVRYTGKSL